MTELVRPEDAKIVKPQEKPGSVGERLHNVELAVTNLARWVEALMAEMERMDARLSALEAKQTLTRKDLPNGNRNIPMCRTV